MFENYFCVKKIVYVRHTNPQFHCLTIKKLCLNPLGRNASLIHIDLTFVMKAVINWEYILAVDASAVT